VSLLQGSSRPIYQSLLLNSNPPDVMILEDGTDVSKRP